MRTLVGCVKYGTQKDYMFPKFLEMKKACIDPVEGVTFAWATDMPWEQASQVLPGDVFVSMNPGSIYVEDMLMDARDRFRLLGIRGEFDKVCYQGLDCLWDSKGDFESVMQRDVPVVSALTSARSDETDAVARRFVKGPIDYEESQYSIPHDELRCGDLIPSGFPGADAIFFSRETLDTGWEDHVPWYDRVARGTPNLDVMEYLCLKLVRKGFQCYVDAGVRVWHVHEDRVARKWPGITRPLDSLAWHQYAETA